MIRQSIRRARLEKPQTGFLLFEADDLSIIPRSAPYIKRLIAERRRKLAKWLKSGKTMAAWQVYILSLYIKRKWMRRDERGQLKRNALKMLKDYEESFKTKYPEYTSPWQKRKRLSVSNLTAMIHRTIARQRGTPVPVQRMNY